MEVTVIKATRSSQSVKESQDRKLRVCAYARVSTDSEEQESSYESQCTHYTDYINSRPEWEFAGLYADEGITGTSTKKRDQFNQMIADCEAGKIDLIITKSVSRWARNTIDSLKYIRHLKDLSVAIYFEKENINTMEATGEVLITIMSSLAQQESASISQNVKMGIRFLMQQGKGRLNTAFFLGYDRDHETGKLVIVPEEADVIRRIYREYLEGYSPAMIANHLTADRVKTPGGKDKWNQPTVTSILQNEKYCGDLLLQKYFVPSFLTHRLVKNEGQLPQYFVEDAHDPIVPKEIFYQVQAEMQRRSALVSAPSKLRFGSVFVLTGRVKCSHCGNTMKRYKGVDGDIQYLCKTRAYERKAPYRNVKSSCGIRPADEDELKKAVIEAFNMLPDMHDELIRLQGGIIDGAIPLIDRHIDQIKEQKERIEERISLIEASFGKEAAATNSPTTAPAGGGVAESSDLSFLSGELENLEAEYTALTLERAEKANLEIQIRLLLELLDIMNGTVKKIKEPAEAACRDYEDFFCRTRYTPADDAICNSKLVSFCDDLIIRYLKEIIVLDDGYNVVFKAGITVNI